MEKFENIKKFIEKCDEKYLNEITNLIREITNKDYLKEFYTDELRGYVAFCNENDVVGVCFTDVNNWNERGCASDGSGLDEDFQDTIYTIFHNVHGINGQLNSMCWEIENDAMKENILNELKKCGIMFHEEFQEFLSEFDY